MYGGMFEQSNIFLFSCQNAGRERSRCRSYEFVFNAFSQVSMAEKQRKGSLFHRLKKSLSVSSKKEHITPDVIYEDVSKRFMQMHECMLTLEKLMVKHLKDLASVCDTGVEIANAFQGMLFDNTYEVPRSHCTG